jgi:heat-inducible transcriptional repressor
VNSEHLSSATLRSIMADLEEAGYISHPHTSAGRVPTDSGYRLYVDALDTSRGLSRGERTRLSENLHATGSLDSLVARCCKLLSAASRQVGVGTAPDRQATIFRHVELVKLSDQRVLVLFIAASGIVAQHVVAMRLPETQAELDRHAGYLNEQLGGRTLDQVRDRLLHLMREERATYDQLARRALELGALYFAEERSPARELYVDGAEHLIDRPDLADFDRMKALLSALEEKSRILRLLDSCLASDGVVTAIGSENDEPILRSCSIVATSYGVDDTRMGSLGIIGPTRMDYDRARALVEYVSKLLGGALAPSRS